MVTESKANLKRTIAIDLDGVLAQYDGWQGEGTPIGEVIEGAKEFVQQLLDKDYDVLVYTARIRGTDRTATAFQVCAWIRMHMPEGVRCWTEVGKPIAIAYVDDRAVVCVPQASKTAFERALGQIRLLALK